MAVIQNAAPRLWRRASAVATAAVLAAVLAACGSGGEGDQEGGGDTPAGNESAAMPESRDAAARFLTQATFGPTPAEVDRVMAIGYGAWIDEQFKKPATSFRALWDAADAAAKASNPTSSVWQDGVVNAFWKQALTGEDQLRGRVSYALSQIFVISMQDSNVGDNPRAVAAWMDMLGDQGLGTYRELIEAVTLHPMMGRYLSSMRNQKADARTGRVPDENYAREVMQLFSIGLHQLNADGTPRQDAGATVPTYGSADIAGLAKVFTGWSWSCPEWPDNSCFYNGQVNGAGDPDRAFKSMMGYPQYHSPEEKRFLGVTVAAQSRSDPDQSLKAALDALATHPNVGPFIGKQLIQRLVTSNPSPAYVAAVAARFDDNGAGVRGDMKAVVEAILMHPEARAMSATSGKLREPVLKLSAYLRAFPHSSDTGFYRVGFTSDAGGQLGQSPMRAPSVFNFYRPGYVPPGTAAADRKLAAPEMQLAHETTAAGYVNFMRDNVQQGVGQWNGGTFNRRDLRPEFSAELALVATPDLLVDRMNERLMYGTMPADLRAEIVAAVASIAIPQLNANASNQWNVDNAKRNRLSAALLLTLVSPEFQVQK